MSAPAWAAQFRALYVLPADADSAKVLPQEAARIRSFDGLSWVFILTGLVPLALQRPALIPLWVLIAAAVRTARGRLVLDDRWSNRVGLAVIGISVAAMGTLGYLWGFIVWLVLTASILVLQSGVHVDTRHIYTIAFVLFLVYSLLTLEYYFLLGLVALVFGGVLLILRMQFPDDVRPGRYRDVLRMIRGPLLAGLGCGVPIFILCPRVPVAVLNIQQPPHTPGFSEEMRLGEMVGALESDRTMMTIRTPHFHHWRGTVLDHYESGRWKRTRRDYYQRSAPIGEACWIDGFGAGRQLAGLDSAEVILEPTDVRFYFSPAFPIAMQNESGSFAYDQALTLQRFEPPQAKRTRYVVWFGKTPTLEHAKAIKAKFLQLPPDLPPRIASTAREVTAGAADDRERCRRIESWLQDNFTYTLGTVAPPGRDPIDYFLFEARSGHCEYFAGAMALMLRTLGIPSRVVLGFNAGKFNEYAGTWTVLERNAHAWVEAFNTSTNAWEEFDPTTGRGAPGAADLAARWGLDKLLAYRLVSGLLSRVDFEWQRSVISFSASMQTELLARLYARYDAFEVSLRVAWLRLTSSQKHRVMAILLLLAALPLLLFRRVRTLLWRLLQWLAALLAGTRLARPSPAPDPLLSRAAFYPRMLALLHGAGLEKGLSETPWVFAARAGARLADAAAPIAAITDAYCRLAYRGHDLAPEQAPELQAALAAIERHLAVAAARQATAQ